MLETLPAYFLAIYTHALMVAAAGWCGFQSARSTYRGIKPPARWQEPIIAIATFAFIAMLFAYTFATVEEIVQACIALIPAVLLGFWIGATWDHSESGNFVNS